MVRSIAICVSYVHELTGRSIAEYISGNITFLAPKRGEDTDFCAFPSERPAALVGVGATDSLPVYRSQLMYLCYHTLPIKFRILTCQLLIGDVVVSFHVRRLIYAVFNVTLVLACVIFCGLRVTELPFAHPSGSRAHRKFLALLLPLCRAVALPPRMCSMAQTKRNRAILRARMALQ